MAQSGQNNFCLILPYFITPFLTFCRLGWGLACKLAKKYTTKYSGFLDDNTGIDNPSFSVKSGQKIGVELLLMTEEGM